MSSQRVRFSNAGTPPIGNSLPDWMTTKRPFPATELQLPGPPLFPPNQFPGTDCQLTSYEGRNIYVRTMDEIWVPFAAGPVVGRWRSPDIGPQWYYHDGINRTPDAWQYVPPCCWHHLVQRWQESQRTYADSSDIQMS